MGALANIAPSNWNDGLTSKQAAFVEHYVRYRNATQAYDHAFDARGGALQSRAVNGSRLLQHPEVAAAIKARQQIATQQSGVDVGWLLQRFIDIGTADPRELIGLKVGCCRFCHGEGHGYQWREREYMEAMAEAERAQAENPAAPVKWPDVAGGFDFNATHPPHPSCPQCHGEGVERFVPRDTDKLSDQALLLYGGVKVKDNGYEIVIADRQKALELAGRVLGAFTDKVRLSGALGHMVAIGDLRNVDPLDAAKAYRDFIGGNMAAA